MKEKRNEIVSLSVILGYELAEIKCFCLKNMLSYQLFVMFK